MTKTRTNADRTPRRRLPRAMALLLLLGLLTAPAVSAQGFYSGGYVTAISDYVFRGISQTGEDPALQLGLDFAWKQLSFSFWATNVDFGVGSTADAEIDLGVAWSHQMGQNLTLTAAATRYLYSGESALNYNEFSLSFEFGSTNLGFYLAPDYAGSDGDGTYVGLSHSISLPKEVALDLNVGRNGFDAEVGVPDYWDYGATLSRSFGQVDLSLAYINTDLPDDTLSNDRLVAGVNVNF